MARPMGEGRGSVGEGHEAQVLGVPRDRRVDIVDHVPDVDSVCRHRCPPSGGVQAVSPHALAEISSL